MPNQLNADEAANDEPKTYNNEAEGEECERGWQDAELDNLKGDLVDEDDGDPRRHSYQDKVTSQAHADTNRRNKDDIGRDLPSDAGPGRPNFPYQQDLGAIVSGLNRPFFPNVSQVPYHAYVPYPSMLFGHSASSDIDGKNGLPRHPPPDVPPSMYSLPGQLGQIPNPLAPPWSPGGPLYPMCTASAMANVLRYPYPFSISSSGTLNNVSPFPLIPPHPHTNGMHPTVIPHHGLPLPGQIPNGHGAVKPLSDKKNMNTDTVPSKRRERDERPSKPYVKKPLNAFMLYMKEQRAKVVAECTLKESAAINQILGRKWHSLNRDEQQKYYEMARKERQMHMQMFPGWSARDNYGKRKKRKKEKAQDCTAQNPKKCRAVFGLEQQQLWCAPCRRKKKCVRYQQDGDDSDYEDSDASPHAPYHGSPNPPCAPIQPDQPNPAGSGQRTSLSSSGCANSSTSSSSGIQGSSSLTDRLSPSPVAVVDQVKQERSSPASCQPTQTNPNTRNGMFIPPTNSYTPEAAEGAFSYSLSETSCGKSSRSNATNNQPSKSFAATSRHPPNVQTAGGKTPNDPGRNKRSNSHSDSPMYVGQNMFASSILSPASMGLNSPHGDRILSQLPAAYLQMSHLAAAANLPASPLNGLMGFHGFKGLSSPVGSALSGSGPSVAPGGHATSTGSRRTASALEGKS